MCQAQVGGGVRIPCMKNVHDPEDHARLKNDGRIDEDRVLNRDVRAVLGQREGQRKFRRHLDGIILRLERCGNGENDDEEKKAVEHVEKITLNGIIVNSETGLFNFIFSPERNWT